MQRTVNMFADSHVVAIVTTQIESRNKKNRLAAIPIPTTIRTVNKIHK